MKNSILFFICAVILSGCFEADYMCDNKETAMNALRIENNNNEIKDDYFKEQIDGFLSGIKITNVGLVEVNDKEAYSVCKANYDIDFKNEKVVEFSIFASMFKNLVFFDMQDQKGLKHHFEKIKTSPEYSEMFEKFKKGTDTAFFKLSSKKEINYKTYDNGRGEIWIEVLE